ncbi:Uncharacterized inner membrane transporter yhbE [Pluralibacter gergoviae]|nr:Uncharacterized inner membrane transporter yhbE [Pluralibacter gergoviae]
MKQQAGIGIALALTTAMCWGALPIAMKQVLVVMEPPTVVFWRFLMASIGLGIILAAKGKLPSLRLFRKPRWLVLLAIATGGLFGNFILFSSSLQYLSPTASQVIGQLSPIGMMVASVVILKEKMRGTQIVGATMLLCGLVMFFNTSLVEIFTRLTDYTWGRDLWRWRRHGLGQLRRRAKGVIAPPGVTADPVFAVHFMYDSAAAAGKAGRHYPAQRLAAGVPDFLRTEHAGRLRRAGGSDGALAGGAGERAGDAHAAVYAVIFRFIISGLARFLRQTDVEPCRLPRCVCRGCGRDVFRHWPSSLGTVA